MITNTGIVDGLSIVQITNEFADEMHLIYKCKTDGVAGILVDPVQVLKNARRSTQVIPTLFTVSHDAVLTAVLIIPQVGPRKDTLVWIPFDSISSSSFTISVNFADIPFRLILW